MFGKKKAERIQELELALATEKACVAEFVKDYETLQGLKDKADADRSALRNQVEYLVRTIRQMDDQIFTMFQKTDWPSMRPHFQTLSDGMTARKVAESNRIGDIMRQELISTYTSRAADAQKKITKA